GTAARSPRRGRPSRRWAGGRCVRAGWSPCEWVQRGRGLLRAARTEDRHRALQPKENPQKYPDGTDQGDSARGREELHTVPKRLSQYIVPIGIVLIIIMMVVPVPSFFLDTLIAANITLAL